MGRKLGPLKALFLILLAGIAVRAQADPEPTEEKPVKVGLVLSAGGAFGLAHIGVLRVLEEEGIPVGCISANSMGSIIGGLYAAGYSAAVIDSLSVGLDWNSLISPGLSSGAYNRLEYRSRQRYLLNLEHRNFMPTIPRGLVSLQKVELLLRRYLGGAEYASGYDFDRLAIPLRIIAVDLNTGSKVTIREGSVVDAIMGSIAVPGVFPSRTRDEKILVDGGVLQYLPVDPIREFEPDLVIASLTVKRGAPLGRSLIDVMSRTSSMIGMEDIEAQKMKADVVIEPDLRDFSPADYGRVRELIEAGAEACRQALPEIRRRLAGRPLDRGCPIRPKTPAPVVRSVRIEGLKLVRERDVLAGVRETPGRALDFDQLDHDLGRIYESGFFQRTGYRLRPAGPDTVDLVLEVEEKEFGFYLLGVRYDNYDNVTLGLELGSERLTAGGLGVRGVINLGEPNEYRVSLTHVDPFVLPFSTGLTAYWSSIDRSFYTDRKWIADYNVDVRGAALSLNNHIGGNAYFSLEFPVQQSLYRYPADSMFDPMPRQEWSAGPSFRIEVDQQDDPFMPGRGLGFRLRADYGLPGLGDANEFTRIELKINQYFPVAPWIAVYYNVDFGMSWGDLPWSASFFTGGDNFIGYKPEYFTSRNKSQAGVGFCVSLGREEGRIKDAVIVKLEADFGSFQRRDRRPGLSDDSVGSEFHVGVGPVLIVKTILGPVQFKTGWADLYPFGRSEIGLLPTALFVSLGRDFRYTR